MKFVAKSKKKVKKGKKRESKQRLKNRRRIIKILAVLVITFLIYLLYCAATLPDINEAVSRTRQPSTTIISENGNEITTFGSVYSEVIAVKDLPQYVPDAVISTEDRRFYSHFGFDAISFTRAMVTNVFRRRYAQGGSTITQQVAKNLFLTPQKSIKRKVQELLLAFWLEDKFTKEQILTLYLNRVYLGAGTYGIEAASQKYFQKSSRDLNLKEAAVIAGLLKAPSYYNPISSEKRAVERATVVLQNMVNNETITKMQMQNALKMQLGKKKKYNVKDAMHFAEWVYNDVNDYIGERNNDIYVMTTLDQGLQQKATQILIDTISANRKTRHVSQGAVVVMDKAGAVKALVGGVDYNQSQFNRATQALRQPGSAFKPFVYLTALQKGYDKEDKIADLPLSIGNWKPENSDRKYYGEVTLEQALAKSLNLATVNLSEQLDRDEIIINAKRMGITTDIKNSPAMALGAMDVKVIDMATAYTSLANGGYAVWPHAIKEIYTKDGYQLYQREVDSQNRILKEKDVKELTKMLESVIKVGTGYRAQLPGFAAGKTGTSQDNRDAWFVGYNEDLITAVWLGNDDNTPMKGVSGANLPAEIWKKIMVNNKQEK